MKPALQRLNRPALAVLLLTLGIFGACKAKENAPVDSLAATPAPAPAAPVNSPSAGDSLAGRITEYGIGALRAGMTYAAANDSLKGALKAAAGANLAECDYVKWEGGPTGIRVMVLEGKIARVETSDSALQTSAGARVGDTEDRIQSLYPGRVAVSPHKYTDGHYLTVKSANAADSLNLIIFETDKGKVKTLRAGIKPGVEFIEGCS